METEPTTIPALELELEFDDKTRRMTVESVAKLEAHAAKFVDTMGVPPEQREKVLAALREKILATNGIPESLAASLFDDVCKAAERKLVAQLEAITHIGRLLSDRGANKASFEAGVAGGLLINAIGSIAEARARLEHALSCDCNEEPNAEEPSNGAR